MSFKLLRARTAGQRRHLMISPLLLLPHLAPAILLLLLSRSASASASTVVTHLPGFDGPLPFYLETGYVGVEEETGTELFYYFVESERSVSTDPVILWLSGGPGCSVFSGLAFEVGSPVKFVLAPYSGDLPRLVYNPLSWTKMASIIFLDSPVGAGFSYARDPKGYDVRKVFSNGAGPYRRKIYHKKSRDSCKLHTEPAPLESPRPYDVGDYSSSAQVQTFLNKWFTDHPQHLSNPFYLGGDSYAGMVIPLIAQNISEGIERREQPLINLKGYLVGNPKTDPKFDENSRILFAHGFGIISDQIYEAAMKNCGGDYVNPANQMCAGVLRTIKNLISEIADGHVLYKKCAAATPKPSLDDSSGRKYLLEESVQLNKPPDRPTLDCITYGYYLAYFWMNTNVIMNALGVKEGTIDEWIRCKDDLPYTFDIPSSIPYHLNLTTRGYRALVYSGDHDIKFPFLGTQAWIRSLNFSIVDDWRAWHLVGQAAGFTILYANNLTFATIKGGGHTAPEYQPEECFAMARRWLDNKPL